MTIQAVFFDMGGTIETYNFTQELRAAAVPGFRKLMVSAGVDLPLDNESFLDVVTNGMKRYHRWKLESLEELTAAQIWQNFLLAGYHVNTEALEAAADELMSAYEDTFYRREMRPEVPSVLEKIREMGYKIGLISNVTSLSLVPRKLKEYGIIHYFDPIVLSSEYGRRKPDPAIFHYAARLANVPVSQCVYIGDRVARDIVGARKAGYALAVQIQHDFEHGEDDSGAAPDAFIHNMSELINLLKAEDRPTRPFPPGQTRAVLFDAGDILYYRPEKGKLLSEFRKQHGFNGNGLSAEEKEHLTDLVFQSEISQDQYREIILRRYGFSTDEEIAAGIRIMTEDDDRLVFFPGVCKTLRTLKAKGYLLGIITDTANSVSTKLRWFERGGFEDVWDTFISSYEVRARKPSPEIYMAALRQLGISASQAIFVGHKASELDGARAVGITTVSFNPDPDAYSDVAVENFSDLLKLPQLS